MVCVDGHTFQDGTSVATVVCKEGEWVPARKEWLSVPDCLRKLIIFKIKL